ncbi:right-handed parallel beta-helix repeat-containing protein [Hymenobacter sp. BRD67]|uniref:right-handed parallel beta-helix repeat-containing protein n=1 Tax=Hymenobacter sp. BRD67 TaxID=2675877 RepID=UPI0015651267|nr:right-handed parallel beta-helix repeat-containing protein [Hymenobacter sp. BRD67]QKG53813.1 right-handed parallel beta-helix repeat-containing protein [Hymenobacter sp. BRD67]
MRGNAASAANWHGNPSTDHSGDLFYIGVSSLTPNPAATPATLTFNNPGGVNSTNVSSGFSGTDTSGGALTSLTLTTFPTGATSITINGTTYTAATFGAASAAARTLITNADGTLAIGQTVSIDPADGGVTYNLPFTVTDVQGATSAPANLTVNFTATSTGYVFEDVNYGGGAGRPISTSGTSPRSGATVELYNTATGAFVASTTTDATGKYTFNTTANTSYTVRVVNSTVTSSRSGYVSGLLPVQTYNGTTSQVGGQYPARSDAAANTTNSLLLTLTPATGTTAAQSLGTFNTANNVGPDFGYNFDTVVNTNDTGQGSLRQFITNANALSNTGLAQVAASSGGSAPAAGVEKSIFMITDGNAHAGLTVYNAATNPGLASQLTNGVAVITPVTALPALAGTNGASTSIDGTTQAQNVGNTNNVTLGTGGTVGTTGTALAQLSGPEVQLTGTSAVAFGLDIASTGTGTLVQGLAIYGFGNALDSNNGANIRSAANGVTITQNVLGTTATAFATPPTANNADNVRLTGGTSGVVVSDNLIGFSNSKGISINAGVTNVSVTGNEVRSNGLGGANYDGVDIQGSSATVTNNLFTGTSGQGIDGYRSAGSNSISGNTISDNGRGTATLPPGETPGVRIYGAGNTITQNIISDNYGAGIMLEGATNGGATAAASTTAISKNAIYNNGNVLARNGAAATGQVGIDLEATGDNEPAGTSPFVTLNSTTTTGANGLLNYPVLRTATVVGNNLVVTGYAKPGATVELYLAQSNPASVNATGTYFGQGKSYLTTFTAGGAGGGSYSGTINGVNQGSDTNANAFTVTIPLTNGTLNGQPVTTASLLTSTATLAGATSEFSGNTRVLSTPVPNDVTNTSIPSNTLTPVVLNPNLSGTATGLTGDLTTSTANTIATYTVNPASTGTLFYNGTPVTVATVVPAANIGQLTFRPVFGSTATATFTYTATDANGTASTTHNTSGTVSNGAATYTIPVTAAADVTTALTGPATVSPGQPSGNYTASFTNEGPQTATTVTRQVTLPTGATNVFVNGASYTPTGNVIDFSTAATLASGASNAYTFSFTPATTATGTLAITSNVTTTTSQGTNAAPDASTILAIVNPVADVLATVTATTTTVAAGTLASAGTPPKFTVVFNNNGPATAAGVVAAVQLPKGLTNVTATNGGAYNSVTGIVTYASLTSIAGSTPTTSVITFDAPATGPVVAAATISTTTNEAGQTTNNTANAAMTITPAFDLATTLTGPTSSVAGDLVTLAVTTTNNGPSAVANAVQTLQLVSGLANVYVSNGGVYNPSATTQTLVSNGVSYSVPGGGVIFPTLPNVPSGQTVANTVSFAMPGAAFAPTALVTPNTSSNATTAGDTNTANNNVGINGSTAASPTSITVSTTAAGMANAYTKINSSVATATVGSNVTLTVITGNNGPNAATGVTQKVQILPGLQGSISVGGSTTSTTAGSVLTFTNGTASGTTYNTQTGIVTFLTLANGVNGSTSGTSVSNTITFAAPASTGSNGQLLATATVSTTNTDPVPADNVAAVAVTLLQSTDLATTITGPASATAGQSVQYTATFLNNGPMAATSVTETAQLPAGLASVTITDGAGNTVSGVSYNATTGQVAFPTQATDANGTMQVYKLTFIAPALSFSPSSSVASSSPDGVVANNNATVATTVTASADLSTSVAGPATAVIGNAVTYSVTTTNNGPSVATSTVTTLQLATGFTAATLQVGGQTGTLSGGVITYGSGATYNTGTGLVTFPTVSSLANGQTVSNYVTYIMPNAIGGQTTGIAAASSAVTDPITSNNTSSVATSIAPTTTTSADITAIVTASASPAVAGSPVTFTATYGNIGTDPAVNVRPTLQLVPGLTTATIQVVGQPTGTLSGNVITFGNGATYNTTTGLVTFPTIASQVTGNTGNVSYQVQITAPNNGPLLATAATTSDTSEPATAAAQANDVNSIPVAITPIFDEVTSISGPASALPGTIQTYTVTTTNNGPSLTANATTQTVTVPSGQTPGSITNSGVYSSLANTITWTVAAGQAAGNNGAVANSFTLVQPAAGVSMTATVAVANDNIPGNNTATITTTATNQPPLAFAVVNSLQSPMGNTVASNSATPNGLLISPLPASDPENALNASTPFTIVNIPPTTQGILYYSNDGTTTGIYAAVTNNKTLTANQAKTLRFLPNTSFSGNASFTYLATDAVNNQSPVVGYTVPVAADQPTSYVKYNDTKGGTNKYATNDILAQVTDPNTAVYTSAGTIYDTTTGILQSGAANGLPTVGTNATLASGTLPAGVSLNTSTGTIYVSNASLLANNKTAQTYTVNVTTTDLNGGTNTAPVSFTIGAYPLPVVLTAFTAVAVQNRDALLSWTTASEQNSNRFEVERSLDGTTFSKIAELAAQGTTATTTGYTYTDANIAARTQGTAYYRLRQVDLDGSASYSPVRAVSFSKVATVALSLYPNPAQSTTALDLSQLPVNGAYQVVVLDATGRQVLATILAGGVSHQLDLSNLATGTYQVLVTGTLADNSSLRQVIRLTKE